jgi:20S proteasome alpha/beta subunit
MTIAAGFNFADGILLCADTKHSASYKVDASKIFIEEYQNGVRSAFVYAGNMRYCRMAIEEFESAIASLKPEEATLPMMRGMVEGALKKMHQEHLYKHPRFRTGDLSIGFVGSIWSPMNHALYNFSTDDTSITRFRGYDCIGTGDYLGHFLIRSRYKNAKRPIALEDVILIATSTLMAIKSYDADCGGDSEFVVVRNDGRLSPVRHLDIGKGERYSEFFDEAVRHLYFAYADPRAQEVDLAASLHAFKCNLSSARHFAQNVQHLKEQFDAVPDKDEPQVKSKLHDVF